MSHHKYSSNIAFNDLLFNTLSVMVVLFFIAFILMNPPTKKADIPSKAEFMVVLEWTDGADDDIDLWIQYEDQQPVGFRHKNGSGIHLERDDLGYKTDTVYVNGVSTQISLNREVATVRGIIPGTYYVGIHGYRVKGDSRKIRVTVIDINPYKEIYSREFNGIAPGEHINLPGFSIDAEGKVFELFDHNRNLGPVTESRAQYMYGDNGILNSGGQ